MPLREGSVNNISRKVIMTHHFWLRSRSRARLFLDHTPPQTAFPRQDLRSDQHLSDGHLARGSHPREDSKAKAPHSLPCCRMSNAVFQGTKPFHLRFCNATQTHRETTPSQPLVAPPVPGSRIAMSNCLRATS